MIVDDLHPPDACEVAVGVIYWLAPGAPMATHLFIDLMAILLYLIIGPML